MGGAVPHPLLPGHAKIVRVQWGTCSYNVQHNNYKRYRPAAASAASSV